MAAIADRLALARTLRLGEHLFMPSLLGLRALVELHGDGLAELARLAPHAEVPGLAMTVLIPHDQSCEAALLVVRCDPSADGGPLATSLVRRGTGASMQATRNAALALSGCAPPSVARANGSCGAPPWALLDVHGRTRLALTVETSDGAAHPIIPAGASLPSSGEVVLTSSVHAPSALILRFSCGSRPAAAACALVCCILLPLAHARPRGAAQVHVRVVATGKRVYVRARDTETGDVAIGWVDTEGAYGAAEGPMDDRNRTPQEAKIGTLCEARNGVYVRARDTETGEVGDVAIGWVDAEGAYGAAEGGCGDGHTPGPPAVLSARPAVLPDVWRWQSPYLRQPPLGWCCAGGRLVRLPQEQEAHRPCLNTRPASVSTRTCHGKTVVAPPRNQGTNPEALSTDEIDPSSAAAEVPPSCIPLTAGSERVTLPSRPPAPTSQTREEPANITPSAREEVDPSSTAAKVWPGAWMLAAALPRFLKGDEIPAGDLSLVGGIQIPAGYPTLARGAEMPEGVAGMARGAYKHRFSVIELGAGTGMPGLVAHTLGAKNVLLTDLEENLPRLKKACAANGVEESGVNGSIQGANVVAGAMLSAEADGGGGMGVADAGVSIAALDWQAPLPPPISARRWDLILAADCVFWTALFDPLLHTLAALCKAGRHDTNDSCSAQRAHHSVMKAHHSTAGAPATDTPSALCRAGRLDASVSRANTFAADTAQRSHAALGLSTAKHTNSPDLLACVCDDTDPSPPPCVLLSLTNRLGRADAFCARAVGMGWLVQVVECDEATVHPTSVVRMHPPPSEQASDGDGRRCVTTT